MAKRNKLSQLERLLEFGFEQSAEKTRILIPSELRRDLKEGAKVYYVNGGTDLFLLYSKKEYDKLEHPSNFPQPGTANFERNLAQVLCDRSFTNKEVEVQKGHRLGLPFAVEPKSVVSLVKFPGEPYLLYLGTLKEMATYLEEQRTS